MYTPGLLEHSFCTPFIVLAQAASGSSCSAKRWDGPLFSSREPLHTRALGTDQEAEHHNPNPLELGRAAHLRASFCAPH